MARHARKAAAEKAGTPRLKPWVGVAALLLLAAAIRFVPLGLEQPRFFHLDEWYDSLAGERMITQLDPHPRRFDNPALYTYALALLYPFVGAAFSPFVAAATKPWLPYVTGRLLSAACGVVGVWLVYRLGRRLMGEGGGVVAALLLALMPLHVWFSHLAKADVMMAMWVALTLLLCWRLVEAPTTRLYALAGLSAGLGAATKYQGVMACVPIFFAHMATPGKGPLWRRLFGRRLWLAAACSIGAFALVMIYLFIDFRSFLADFEKNYRFIVAGEAEERAARAPALVAFGGQALLYIGPVPLVLMVVGGVLWWRRKRRALLVVGSVVACYVLLISGWAFPQAHYLMPMVPAAAVLAAAPIAHLWPRRRRVAATLLVLALAPAAAVSARQVVRLWRPDTRLLAQQWLVRNLRGRYGCILRDYDALRETAKDVLERVKNPGFGFYEQVDREYLARNGITHFVLSDSVASTRGMPPAKAARRREGRERLLATGKRLVRIPPGWWRQGPGIEIYKVKDSVLREFAEEQRRRVRDLIAKLAAVENELGRKPDDAALHLEAGRLLTRLGGMIDVARKRETWTQAERHFREAAALDPTLADAHYDRGCLYLQMAAWFAGIVRDERHSLDYFGRAVEPFRQAIALDPGQADYRFNLAYALWCTASGEPAQAAKALEDEGKAAFLKAAQLDPDLQPPDFHLLAIIERGPRPLR